jgi:hypothetical protein
MAENLKKMAEKLTINGDKILYFGAKISKTCRRQACESTYVGLSVSGPGANPTIVSYVQHNE